ncbi:MAG: TolC family protein [Candidatus Amulumruptor sp.]|nr:TolC family protein [Candidatus Amulumruptor sp.]
MKKFLLSLLIIFPAALCAQNVNLTLQRAIEIANDSSLQAFRVKNMYLSDYWQFRSFKAARLPSLSLSLTPASYNRYIRQRYDSQENIDVYRAQQMYSASGSVNITQNFDPLGGTFYLESGLEYMRNFGDYTGNQFSSIPVRLGYRQSLIGYNSYRWDRKIEPLKFEKAQKELIQNMEGVAESAVTYYFNLALAQEEYRLAVNNLASCDTLYITGERRFKIQAISEADLLTLKLDRVNAQNTLENARISLKRAMFSLATFLGLDQNSEITVTLPSAPLAKEISTDLALQQARSNNPGLLQHRQNILEAKRELNRTTVESRFSADINASIGFNQVAPEFKAAYQQLLRQDLVSLSITIPLVDWGVRKGKVNMARNNLNVVEIAARQEELGIEEDVVMTVSDFNIQQQLVASALEALDLADMAYDRTKQRFMIGKADISALTLSQSRQQSANTNYIRALQNYWLSYYRLRKLTLYDFDFNRMITIE